MFRVIAKKKDQQHVSTGLPTRAAAARLAANLAKAGRADAYDIELQLDDQPVLDTLKLWRNDLQKQLELTEAGPMKKKLESQLVYVIQAIRAMEGDERMHLLLAYQALDFALKYEPLKPAQLLMEARDKVTEAIELVEQYNKGKEEADETDH